MTSVFLIHLSDSGVQATLMQSLKSAKADVIQTGSGLCVKTDMTEGEISKLAGDGVQIEKLDSASEKLTPDVRAFLNGK